MTAAYGLTGGRDDDVSRSATVPRRFEVLVAAGHGDRARAVLGARHADPEMVTARLVYPVGP